MDAYILVLDDTRPIEEVSRLTPEPFWTGLPAVLCLDYKQGQKQVVSDPRLIAHVCLDHNLYGSPNHMNLTGLHFAQWLCHHDECQQQVLTADFTYSVHSTDEENKKKIEEVMQEHQEYRRQTEPAGIVSGLLSPELNERVRRFARENAWLADPTRCKNMCANASVAFLTQFKYPSPLSTYMANSNGPEGEHHWLLLEGVNIDFTARQFDPSAPFPKIWK